MTKCRKSGSKAAYNYKNEDFLLHKVNKMEIERVTNPLFSPRKSIVLEDKVFSNLVWWDQMTEIQNERNIRTFNYHAHNHTHGEKTEDYICVIVLLDIFTFSALRVDLLFLENIMTLPMFSPEII